MVDFGCSFKVLCSGLGMMMWLVVFIIVFMGI